MQSEIGVSHGRGEFALITNLVFHHGIANVLDQTVQFTRILDVVEKTFNLPLICQWLEFSESFFEFPKDPCFSDLDLDLRDFRLTVLISSSFLAP